MRKCFFVLSMLLCAMMLGGCHGSEDRKEFTLPEEFDTSREYEITFWAKNDTNIKQTTIYEQAIKDFEALYPNIKVTLRLYTDYGRIYNDVITNMATDTTPNVCITYPDHIATYLTGENSVVPVGALFGDEKYGLGGSEVRFDSPTQDEIVPQFLKECMINGQYYAIPYMRSTEACYVNVTLLNKLGYELPETLTWEFVWEVSEAAAATKGEDGIYSLNGQNILIPFIYKSTDNMMIQLLRQHGAGYSNGQGEISIFNDTTKDLLYDLAGHVEKGAFSTFKISSYPGNFLNAGQCIFAIDSTAGATWMGADAPLSDIHESKKIDFETAVCMIPQVNPNDPKMISQGPSVCVFNKEDPQEVLASWLFAQYLLTNEVQIAYSQTEGYVPVTNKALKSDEYVDYLEREGEDNELYYPVKLQAAKLLLDNVSHTFVTPVFVGSASLRDAAGQMIENVTKSVRRKQTIDEKYMAELETDITALYRLNLDGTGSVVGGGKISFGALPAGSVALLVILAITWLSLGIFVILTSVRKKKNKISA